ncbi:TMV resistance protein N isoform X1 [Amborella trichopoda]|nr:TMV resistance protein N isoform X1 [Amborella trichopoda]|eukprot:XP_006853646.3 TMV resistance protein N isoform X1 [Amborella trichopoda]
MEVFLNFCDEDTGKGFTAHLHKALTDSGIPTFLAPTQQQQHLPHDIQRAIGECEVFIPVFSSNYTSSVSCLHQLSYLLSLPTRKPIFPVFYDVEAWQVRWQKEPFQRAFVDHKDKNAFDEETVQRWRNAFNEVAEICGWEMKNYRTEADLVREIVEHVSKKFELQTPLHVADHPIVGLDSHIVDLMGLLNIDTNDARIIGIHGMGGIGKTTLARVVFNTICSRFQGNCFLSDVRDSSKTKDGVINLQKQLLMELFKEADPRIYDVYRGINVIKKKIGSKKVLVIIDDVDNVNQLENLAIDPKLYHQGSRIMITTRDEHVFNKRVDKCNIYKLEGLDDNESLKLFSWCAFGRDEPVQEYAHISKDVLSTASGLPLTLKVLGSYLSDKTLEEWKEAVKKLRTISEEEVMPKLRISFDGLDGETKQIFLDIACLLIGYDRDRAIEIWKGCGFPALNSLRKLLQRSLIKINKIKINKTWNSSLWMHDQLRDMGRHFVEQENLGDPGRRSRLWSQEDVIDVLKNGKGTPEVRGLALDWNKQGHSWKPDAFKSMTNLKLLRIIGASVNESLKCLSSELVWLEWKGPPLKYLSDSCSYEKLVELDISNSDAIFGLSNNNMKLLFPKLKILRLMHCKKLERIPHCSLYPNLVHLQLPGCSNLKELPDSLGSLENLKELNLDFCSNLVEIPKSIGLLHNLVHLQLTRCFNLKELPDSLGSLANLKELNLNCCSNLVEIPKSIGLLHNLVHLQLTHCFNLKELPDSLGSLANLKELDLSACESLSRLPTSMERMRSLRHLRMERCAIATLPGDFWHLSNLEELRMGDYFFRGLILGDIEKWSSLKTLDLGMINLQGLHNSMRGLSQLEDLSLVRCCKLASIPELPTSLKYLNVSGCKSLQTIPNLSHLSQLKYVNVSYCKKLLAIDLPTSLKTLNASNCISLEIIPNLSHLSELIRLDVSHCEKLSAMEDLPTTLKILKASNWMSLESIPNLSHLSQLQELDVSDCENLLAIGDLPTTLKTLRASNSISLKSIPNLSHLSQLIEFDLRNCERMTKMQVISGLKSLRKLDLSGCSPLVWRGQNLAKEIFTSLDYLCVPGSKVPNWFAFKCTPRYTWNSDGTMHQQASCTLSRPSHACLHNRKMMLCLVVYVHHITCTSNVYRVDLLFSREGEVSNKISLPFYPGTFTTHQKEIRFDRFPLNDADQIEVVNDSRHCKHQDVNMDGLCALSRFPCIELKKVGIHFI